jgi:hypothetical protein
MIKIDDSGGRIGGFWWVNTDQGCIYRWRSWGARGIGHSFRFDTNVFDEIKQRGLRYCVFYKLTHHIADGVIPPWWMVLLRAILFPISTAGSLIYSKTSAFDIWSLTWTIHGCKFSDTALMHMAGRCGKEWMKFERQEDGLVVVTGSRRVYGPEERLIHEGVDTKTLDEAFYRWWWDEGSGDVPLPGHDHEEHARRIARIAWHNGAYIQKYRTQKDD